uniref:ATP synthase complex subunit 8 n=1 Tax=Celastrina lavendularis TaxID=1453171 RepID=A0A9E9M5F7_9NEOP|nr:ATP synthase F0 subunit 8 [Celastrina lavendularis]YP_010701141.1 ATP synthase F0 subunit 8 [Celastrina oreas]WAW79865.1 ATP synthase F0 subunit 8 [Celastrina lavendularis]WCI21382.1 ATP synthase F0 subunit 8 [Celastrina oreas]
MPQMMPINWILSFIFFINIFILFNIMNYYIFYYKNNINNNKILKKNKILYWKW